MASEELFVMVVMTLIGAGVLIVVLGLRQRAQQLELAHRERMAMIDKGLVPSPEMSPGHATWATGPTVHLRALHDRPTISSQKSLTLGIVIVSIGLGFMTLIGIAAETPHVAIGIGGAIAIVGVAFIVISLTKRSSTFASGHDHGARMPPPPVPLDRPADPPL